MSENIAARLQRVRQMYGLSQRELAKRAGVTNSSISMIEQGRVSPQISSLEKLLGGIPMAISDFFALDMSTDYRSFYHSYELELTRHDKIDCYTLAADKPDKRLNLHYEVHERGSDSGVNMLSFEGERSGFVVDGSLEVTINNQCNVLEPGDGFFIESRQPHRIRNVSDEKAVVVISNFAQL